MRKFRFDNPYLMLVLPPLFWSGNFVVGRGIRADVPPVGLVFWRWIVAFLCVLPLAWPHRKAIAESLRKDWFILSVLSLLGIVGYNTLAYFGLQYTTATNGVLLNSFIPIVIIGISCAFLGKRLVLKESLGVLASLAGVTVIVAHGELATLRQLSFNPGDIWIMAAVLAWAGYTILLQYRPKGLHPMALLAVLTGMGIIGLLPLYVWELTQGRVIHPTPVALAGIAYTGIFPAFLGYVCWNRGVAQVGSSVAGLFIHIMPIATPLLSAMVLGEAPHLYHFGGMALIIGGIGLTTRS